MKLFDIRILLSIFLLFTNFLSAQNCPDFTQNNLVRTTENCQSGIQECLPINFEFSENYEFTLNGSVYNGTLSPCSVGTIAGYDVLGIGNYPVNIDSWEVNGSVYNDLTADSPAELATIMTGLSNVSWSFDATNFVIQSTSAPDSLGWLVLTEIATGLTAEIIPQYSSAGSNTAVEFPIGDNIFIAYNLIEDCADTLLIDVICQQITDSLFFTIEIGASDNLVFDPTNLDPVSSFINECTVQSGTAVAFTIDPTTYSLEYFGIEEGGPEQACIVMCGTNGICDTTYVFVTVTDPASCTDPFIADVNIVDMNCDEPGSIQLSMQDQNQDYQFNWGNNLPDTDYLFDLQPGTYSVTITYTDSIQQPCFTTATYNVGFLDSIESYDYSFLPSCNGNGSVIFSNPGLTYTWPDGLEARERYDLFAGEYSVTVTTNNCEEVTTVLVAESNMHITGTVNNVCDSLGAIFLDIVGGFSPYSYNWNDGANVENRIDLAVGMYTVTVTDVNGCFVENTFEIIDDCPSTSCTQPEIVYVEIIHPSCLEPGSIVIELSDNSVEYDFDWSHNGQNSPVQIDLWAADFEVTISNVNTGTGEICATTANFTLTEIDTLDFSLISVMNATCNESGAAAYSNNNFIYSWSDGGQGRIRNDLAPGEYTITVTAPTGNCEEETFLTITEEPAINISANVSNVCDTLGAVYLSVNGNFGPFTYEWSNGSNTQSQPELEVGFYSVTVTDDQGCTVSEDYNIVDDCSGNDCVDPVIADATTVDPSCTQGGMIDVSVVTITPNITYQWSNGEDTNLIIDLSAGSYNVTISDMDSLGNVCSITAFFTLTAQDSLDFFLENTTSAGCGNLGSAEYSDPSLFYEWSDGGAGHMRDDLLPGTYTVTVTNDQGNCSEIATLTINDASAATEIFEIVSNVCDTLGSIYLSVNGGTEPYVFNWSNGTVTQNQPSLNVGTYSVTVTDAQGCLKTETYEIVDDCPPAGEITFTFFPADENIGCGDTAPVVDPIAASSCPGEITYDFSEIQSPNCGNTNIVTRTWVATDDCGNTVSGQQTIFEEDLEAPEIVTIGEITIDLLNGDSLPNPFSLAFAEDDCGMVEDLSFNKEENITDDGYEVVYNWIAQDACGNVSTEFQTIHIIGGMIWPGDTDSNKVVNNFDVFNIGFAYGETGPARINSTLDFLPQYAASWSTNGIDDVNFRHADTDGNGIVDEQDILAVNMNYDLVHNLQEAGDTRETFAIDFVYETVTADNWVHVAILLGNTAEPIDDFYGAGFIIEYDQNMVVPNTAHVDFSESWTGTFFSDFIALQKDFYDEGRLDVGLVRTNQQGIDGSGKIGSFRFQLPEGIEFSPFLLTTREGSGVRADKSPYELETTEVMVTNVRNTLSPSAIKIYPNPVQTELFLNIPAELEVTDIQLFGTNGQMLKEYTDTNTRRLETSSLTTGLYYLRVLTNEGTWTHKVNIINAN